MANSVMNTAPARLANSLSSARWKIMRYDVVRLMEFSIKTLSPETAKSAASSSVSAPGGGLTAAARRASTRASKGALHIGARRHLRQAGSTLLLRASPASPPSACCSSGWASARNSARRRYRDAVRAAAQALKELGAKDAALFLVDMKVGSRAAELERAPRRARRTRRLLPLRPAQVAEESPAPRSRT